jgi:thioredoxin-like negative regulator of GroEL
MQFAVVNLPMLACAVLRLGLTDEVVDALASHPESPWTEAARAYLDHDFAGAAEILARTGAKPDEAEARLRAAERLVAEGRRSEADEELARALDFYRSVGATRYLREGNALRAALA